MAAKMLYITKACFCNEKAKLYQNYNNVQVCLKHTLSVLHVTLVQLYYLLHVVPGPGSLFHLNRHCYN